jgi:pre-mRNA-processing factor SLU7
MVCISLRHLVIILKYLESVFINNHSSVWGSWYDISTGTWGYACCHSTVHVSYCAGKAGIEATNASKAENLLASDAASTSATESRPSIALAKDTPAPSDEVPEQNFSKKRMGEGDVKLDKERLAQALSEERKRKNAGDDDEWAGKRRKDVHTGNHDVTEEELGTFALYNLMASFFLNA